MTDEEGVRRTLAAYCQLIDDGRVDEWAELFTTDATFTLPGAALVTREAIRAEGIVWSAPEHRGKHLTLNSLITIDGDVATAASDFLVLVPRSGAVVSFATGRYFDRLVREGERWRIATREVAERWRSG